LPTPTHEPVGSVYWIVESPLSERDAQRFGIRTLRNSGFDVNVWDVSQIYLPHSNLQTVQTPADIQPVKFSDSASVQRACTKLVESDLVISLCGTQIGQLSSHGDLLSSLSQSRAALGTVSATHIPRVPRVDSGQDQWFSRQRLLERFIEFPRRFIYRHSLLTRMYQRWMYKRRKLRPLDMVWCGTNIESVHPLLLSAKTTTRFIHSLDYDLVLTFRESLETSNIGPVLIDSMGPLHPDYASLQESTDGLSEIEYFQELRSFLDAFERVTKSRVQIAAHPRAMRGLLEERYGGRTIHYGQTIRLVALADVVVLTLASTAVGAAVAFAKPIIGVELASVDVPNQVRMKALASLLGFPLYTADFDFMSVPDLAFDRSAYAHYMTSYVKRPGTPELQFWEAVAIDAREIVYSGRLYPSM
jgi:hypothetical protein